jgi:hypothetical protein
MTQPAGTPGEATAETPAPTQAPPPTTQAPPPSAPPEATTAPAEVPSATPGIPELARPNGVVVHAPRRDTAPAIDAQFQDWPAPLPYAIDQVVYGAEAWAGAADQSGQYALSWDAAALYLLVIVTDDVHVQGDGGLTLYRGDSLELQLDADLAGDFGAAQLNGDDHQLGLSPGVDAASPEVYLWNPPEKNGVPGGVGLAARPHASGGGYALEAVEAAIPWSLLGVNPVAGSRFGFALNSSDNDSPGTTEQQTMISSVITRRLLDPTSWGTLALDP